MSIPQTQSKLAARASERGMTLIEILVVLAIIGLVMGGVGVYAFGQFKQARVDNAWNEIRQLEMNIETYMMQANKCPKTMQDLKARGVIKKVTKDPWGEEWVIKCPGEHGDADISSGGPDKTLGNEDDVNSWETKKAAEDAKNEDKDN